MWKLKHLARGLSSGMLLIALCSGCATQFNPADAAQIKTIGFSGFKEPQYRLSAFSPVSLLPADIAGHPDFSDQMAKEDLHLGAEMKATIAEQLHKSGYIIVDGAGPADAILDLTIGGFPPESTPAYSAGTGNYEPEFMATAKLVDTKTNKTLFNRVYVYRDNSFSPMDGSLLIRPDPKYGIKKALDVYANPHLAAEGLRAGGALIALSISDSLKKQP